jgi:Zn-dependent protease with chaperone function
MKRNDKGNLMETCLRKSIKQYRQILDHAEQLDRLLVKSDPDELRSYTVRLQELQDEAGLNDRIFLEVFPHNSEAWKDHPLFLERTQLLEQIVELNHLLLPRIRGMMAVTAHELSQIKGGRVAVAGYRSAPAQSNQYVRGVG